MRVFREYWPLLIGSIVLIVGVIAAWNARYEHSVFATYSHGHILVDRSFFASYYSQHGGSAMVAYAEQIGKSLTRANYHSLGHSVGEVLFEHEGLGAVATCGDSFEYGCLHQVIGKAFDVYGKNSLSSLEARCAAYSDTTQQRQCQHGLGHGLMYEAAYSDARLESLMNECDTITTKRPIPFTQSCHAGLMMEYNEHFMTMEYQDRGVNGRSASTTDSFAICNKLTTKEHKNLCVWWAVPWLHGNLYDFDYTPQTFRSLGKLCEQLKGDLYSTCYQAIGRQAGINADLYPKVVVDLCMAASSEPAMQRICIEQAARLYVGAGNMTGGEQICALVRNDAIRSCRNVKGVE